MDAPSVARVALNLHIYTLLRPVFAITELLGKWTSPVALTDDSISPNQLIPLLFNSKLFFCPTQGRI